jgi:hypothetical protein
MRLARTIDSHEWEPLVPFTFEVWFCGLRKPLKKVPIPSWSSTATTLDTSGQGQHIGLKNSRR